LFPLFFFLGGAGFIFVLNILFVAGNGGFFSISCMVYNYWFVL
jgi:hypothetical protein